MTNAAHPWHPAARPPWLSRPRRTRATPPPATGPDAALIRCCGRLIALRADAGALGARRDTIDGEDMTEAAMARLNAQYDGLTREIDRLLPPLTPAGARAAANAALAETWAGEPDGLLDVAARLALAVIEYVADTGPARTRPSGTQVPQAGRATQTNPPHAPTPS